MSTDFSWLAIRCTFLHPWPTPNWLTISFLDRTVNPGPDLIHCHLSQHATGGMVEVLLEGIELVDLPEEYAQPQSQQQQ